MTTPVWQAGENGLPGHLASTNQSAQVDQLLAAHQVMPIYQGTQVLAPTAGAYFDSGLTYSNITDLDQPFVLSGTSIGRVVIPVIPVGNGADLLVTLCPDNGSGAPLTSAPIAATAVPGAAINQLAAVDGLENAAGPLQTPASNTLACNLNFTQNPWAAPAGDATGIAQNNSSTVSGSYFIFAGGSATSSSTTGVTAVATAQYLGGGNLAQGVSQPALPQGSAYAALTATSSSVIYMGGDTGSAVISDVWVASWDANTGLIGSWSAQTALPAGGQNAAAATWNDTAVYYLGGANYSNVVTSAVYWTTISNGQLGSWTAGPSLPTPLASSYVGVFGNWIVVAGGSPGSAVASSAVYYAAINPATGALGAWQTGPNLPVASFGYGSGWDCAVTDNALVVVAGNTSSGGSTGAAQILTVTAEGPSSAWHQCSWENNGVYQVGAFATGSGQWDLVNPNIPTSVVWTTTLTPAPLLSVPLYATGLTSGNTYHVVMQQHVNATASDYLAFCVTNGQPLPLNPLKSLRHSGTWVVVAATWCVPMSVYNATAGGPVWHTWEDPNAYSCAQRTSTLLYNNYQLPIGMIEQTLKANPPRNANSTFTSGVTPWTVSGGTLTQSSAQTHGGYAFSGLLTPSGSAVQAYAASELFPVGQGGGPFYGASQWYLADGWVYCPLGYSQFSLSVSWFDAGQTYLSTDSMTQTLTAATWTHAQNWALAPAQAAYANVVPTLGGTPASSVLLYMSDVFLILSPECVGSLTSAAAIEYPSGAPWPPVGVEQLL